MKNTTQGNALKELKMFKTMARGLEEELMKEKTKHQRLASKHGQQYRDLLEEVPSQHSTLIYIGPSSARQGS